METQSCSALAVAPTHSQMAPQSLGLAQYRDQMTPQSWPSTGTKGSFGPTPNRSLPTPCAPELIVRNCQQRSSAARVEGRGRNLLVPIRGAREQEEPGLCVSRQRWTNYGIYRYISHHIVQLVIWYLDNKFELYLHAIFRPTIVAELRCVRQAGSGGTERPEAYALVGKCCGFLNVYTKCKAKRYST